MILVDILVDIFVLSQAGAIAVCRAVVVVVVGMLYYYFDLLLIS